MTGKIASPLFLFLLLDACSVRTSNLVSKRLCTEPAEVPASATYLPNVADSSGLVLNGDAASVAGALRLTPAVKNSVGSAYFAEPFAFDTTSSLYAHFSLVIGGAAQPGGDGMTFVLQSSVAGPNALGADGDGLGWKTITPSVAVEFDTAPNTFDPDSDHVALVVDGKPEEHLAFTPTPPLNDGVVRYVWIDYDGPTHTLRVDVSSSPERPTAPTLAYAGLNFSSVLTEPVYLGFSASTGEGFNDHDLLGEAWFSPSPASDCSE